jgi:hypothetical protein
MDIFETCRHINELIYTQHDAEARDTLIKLLDWHQQNNIEYTEVVNSLIRSVGLYPYLDPKTASWDDGFVYDAFSVDVGGGEQVTLHREQSGLLKRLINGESLALSAPTSFGKSFVIDSFITIKKPNNVLIIVPTLALVDETRRRIHKKFAHDYRIITTTSVEPALEKNIFIFPQERAISCSDKIGDLDLLVVDEFYKASGLFDKERSAALIRAILKFSARAKQRYFLAPNIARLIDNQFTKGMDFLRLDFNTVFLETHSLYPEIGKDALKKSEALVEILRAAKGKSLVYAGTYSGIAEVSNILLDRLPASGSPLLTSFKEWLDLNYGANWELPRLIARGIGVHNGQLHRSLSQIQIRLFEEPKGITTLVSTSSIIEGVNTSAENVILWRNKNGKSKLTDFEYRNIIGRSGRMFRHFVGKVYVLEEPPQSTENQLALELPDSLVGLSGVGESDVQMSDSQIEKSRSYSAGMADLLGLDYEGLRRLPLQSSDTTLLMKIATEIRNNLQEWRGLGYFNSPDANEWSSKLLYQIINFVPGGWDIEYGKFVSFIRICARSWVATFEELLDELAEWDIGIDQLFKLERNLTYKLASLLGDVNVIHRAINEDNHIDISPFVFRCSNAFLPVTVFQLEEYGLPRMISKKIHAAGILNFENDALTLESAIRELVSAKDRLLELKSEMFSDFDRYIIAYFYDGIGELGSVK